GRAGDTAALPQGERPEQARRSVGSELSDQLSGLVVALAQEREADPAAQLIGCLPGRSHRREQAERRPAGSLDELAQLVQVGSGQTVATRRRQVPGDVQDATARMVERRSDVDTRPCQRMPLNL